MKRIIVTCGNKNHNWQRESWLWFNSFPTSFLIELHMLFRYHSRNDSYLKEANRD